MEGVTPCTFPSSLNHSLQPSGLGGLCLRMTHRAGLKELQLGGSFQKTDGTESRNTGTGSYLTRVESLGYQLGEGRGGLARPSVSHFQDAGTSRTSNLEPPGGFASAPEKNPESRPEDQCFTSRPLSAPVANRRPAALRSIDEGRAAVNALWSPSSGRHAGRNAQAQVHLGSPTVRLGAENTVDGGSIQHPGHPGHLILRSACVRRPGRGIGQKAHPYPRVPRVFHST